jgi:hypothetical protein
VVLNVPTTTYIGEDLKAFDSLNKTRSIAGSGKVAQNSQLDTSSSRHARYLQTNLAEIASVGLHNEVIGRVGFSGATPQERMTGAGYVGTGSELASNFLLSNGTGEKCIQLFTDYSLYHRFAILSSWIDVGISVITNSFGETSCVINVGKSATLSGGQIPVSPITYPYSNQTGVATTFVPSAEAPNPAPDVGSMSIGVPVTVSLATQDLLGASLVGFNANDVVVSEFTLTGHGTLNPVAARILAMAGVRSESGVVLTYDPNPGYMDASSIALLPLSPLTKNLVYDVKFKAMVKGKLVSLNWSFTTGAGI